MARLKKYNIHKAICDTCDGNGYVKIIQKGTQDHVRQCWECDSEGEYYVYNSKKDLSVDDHTYDSNTDKFLH
jgi:DnaJ-class molecular chaperone